MLSLETLESQVAVVMETVVEAAVTELRRLLDLCSANVKTTAAEERSAPAVKDEEQRERQVTPPEDNKYYKDLTNQFVSLMSAWTKSAAEKILMMLKVSLCEAEDGAAAEQRLTDETNQTSVKLKATKAGRVAGPKKDSKSSRLKRKGELLPAFTQENDHSYHRVEQQPEVPTAAADPESQIECDDVDTEVCNSESTLESEALLTNPSSELDSDVRAGDVVQEETETATNTLENRKNTTRPFQCPSCDKSFTLKCLMERHYLSHSKPHLCQECGKRFSVLRGLEAHSRRHTGEKLHKCVECGTEFAHKSTFVRHMRRHALKQPNTRTCTLCEGQFSGALALQRHRCSALNKTFVCSLCPETFECRRSLADHESLHSGDRDFVCEMCGDSFFTPLSLATHRFTHVQKENCCDVLGLGCSDFSVLKNHLSKHTGEKLFSCEVCGKGCSHKSALKHHMLTHTGERPYVCETCGKRCGHASALQNHMRIHTGKKPGQQPVCDVCGKSFRSTVKLKYHMSIHTGEKPYACDQCGKKFSNPSNRRVHQAIHSGEKLYGCNVCGKRFTQSTSLKLHRSIHTGEKPYNCQVCGKGFLNRGDFRKHQRSHLGVTV
ncbi:zinc finger protein 883-like [Labrus mixtus]|uniref:zinc finger protein 883-like n=1 Tax=Labrus mixtus TaxID=508554 RepID=UPI0029C01AE4|nr:zinc finger protein 883-like [Labrus mixtus]